MKRRQLSVPRIGGRGILTGLLLAGLLVSPAKEQHKLHHQASKKDTTQTERGIMTGHMHGGDHAVKGQGTMQNQMQAMHQMMSQPVMRTMMMTTAIPAMRDALNLSDEQVRKLDEMSESLKRERTALTETIEETEKNLRGELGNLPDADPKVLESLTRKRASLAGDLQALTLGSAMQMHGVLSADQQTVLASMDPAQMHQHMAAHMSDMEMMKAMRSSMMAGMSCPMMSRMSGMNHSHSMPETN